MADEYCNLLTRTPSAPANPVQLRAMLQRLMIQLSRVEAKRTRHRILHIRRTVKTRHHALAKGGHTRNRNQRPSCSTPGKWPQAKARHDVPRKRPTVDYCAPKAHMSIDRPTSGARPAPFHHMKPDGYRSNIKPSHKFYHSGCPT